MGRERVGKRGRLGEGGRKFLDGERYEVFHGHPSICRYQKGWRGSVAVVGKGRGKGGIYTSRSHVDP